MEFVSVNNVNIYPFASQDDLINYIDQRKGILVAINTEKIVNATEQTRQIINRNIGYCDGAGALLALRRKGHKNVVKIAGCDLWHRIVETFHGNKSFYLIGGKQPVIEQAVKMLRNEFEDINLVGYRNGYLKDTFEEQQLIDDVAVKNPDVVFVAMGSPRQELLMERIQERCPNTIFQGLGGSIDVYAGYAERAPKWMIDHNMEFAYRVAMQPKRIGRLMKMLPFIWNLVTGNL